MSRLNLERLVAGWCHTMNGIAETVENDSVRSTVLFSADKRHRYLLARIWDNSLPPTVVIMANPSTADARKNDPTVARMVNFAHDWNCGGLIVLNVFALRSTDPAGIVRSHDPVGRYNLSVIKATLQAVISAWGTGEPKFVAAWGALAYRLCKATHRPAVDRILVVWRAVGLWRPMCLRLTKAGYPYHPLYVARATRLIELPG